MTNERVEEIRAEVCPSCDHPRGPSWSLWQGSVRLAHGIYESEARAIIAIIAQAEREREGLQHTLDLCNQALDTARAEVERLKDIEKKYHEALDVLSAWDKVDKAEAIARAQQAEATLARVRGALDKITYGEWLHLTEGHGTSAVYEQVLAVRAALEGRG